MSRRERSRNTLERSDRTKNKSANTNTEVTSPEAKPFQAMVLFLQALIIFVSYQYHHWIELGHFRDYRKTDSN